MRDGYAPREYWQELESSVLDTISLMAEHTSSITKVVCDHELYLGAEGWVD